MNLIKRTKKGFTLIELIIVLAIFSVIMVLVMSFIDPVSKIMKKSSTRERTASYVDNINEYLEKSLRYAQYVRVFEGDFCNNLSNNGDGTYNTFLSDYADVSTDAEAEKYAVMQFVDDYFDGAICSEYEMVGTTKIYKPLTGKVHVLKLCNDKVFNSGDKPGTVYETVYDFTAGESAIYEVIEEGGAVGHVRRWSDDHEENMRKSYPYEGVAQVDVPAAFAHSVVTPVSGQVNMPVINPEHFTDYSYFYQLGDFSFDAMKADKLSEFGLTEPRDGFYSALTRLGDGYINNTENNTQSFVLCTVTYQNNNKGNNMSVETNEDGDSIRAFLSPAYMNMTGSTLINSGLFSNPKRTDCYRYDRAAGTKDDVAAAGNYVYASSDTEKTQPLIKPISVSDSNGKSSPFKRAFDPPYTAKFDGATTSDNIYFIYVIPRELNTSVDIEPTTTTSPT